MQTELTIIIPALNEEEVIEATLLDIIKVMTDNNMSYEVIVVNDGSTDQTRSILDRLTKSYDSLKIIHKERSENIGRAYRDALQVSNSKFVTWVPADGEIPASLIYKMFINRNNKNIIISYPRNSYKVRPLSRLILSKTFQFFIRLLFLKRIRYFNCPTLLSLYHAKRLNLISNGFTINMETVLRAINEEGLKYIEVGFDLCPRGGGEAKAINIKNIVNVLKFVFMLRFRIPCEKL